MIRPVSKARTIQFLNDFQVLKGQCPKTMQPFGAPVSEEHEAELMIRDDKQKLAPGAKALYVIHQRSENRITQIIEAAAKVAIMPKPMAPLPKAA